MDNNRNLENIKYDLTCPISLELLNDPITTPCCGKAFSRLSLMQHFLYNDKMCPLCKGNLENFDPVLANKSTILANLADSYDKLIQCQQVNHLNPPVPPQIKLPTPPVVKLPNPARVSHNYYNNLKKPHRFYK